MFAAVTVGCGIGYVLDQWMGATPVFLLIFLLLGTIAGFLNVYRASQRSADHSPPSE